MLKAPSPTWTFAVFMRPGLHREVQRRGDSRRGTSAGRRRADAGPVGFSEHLRRHDAGRHAAPAAIRDAVLAGEQSEAWLEERRALLDALFAAEEAGAAKVQASARAKTSTRREIARRLRLAADYMDTCYAEPIDLQATARVACLSRFHLVRFFRALYGVTPHAWLVAARGRGPPPDRRAKTISSASRSPGFGTRASLRRALAKHRSG